MSNCDVLVVGAGFYGLTVADRLADQYGLNVTVIDRRDHVGGNSYSYFDRDTGIEVHQYGSHIFHTSSSKIYDYISRFTQLNEYVHTVYSVHKGKVYSLPFNLATINSFFGTAMGPAEAEAFISSLRQPTESSKELTLDQKGISMVGKELYEAFIKNYTAKQWQTDPEKLPASIISRIPVRYTYDNRYFGDKYQGLPVDGYGAWHERMLNHKNIEVHLNTDFFDPNGKFSKSRTVGQIPVIYTGPIDTYFDYQHKSLGWRTIDFETEVKSVPDFQGTSVMNYPDLDVPYTRIHEFQHYHPERSNDSGKTVVMKEYSRFANESDEPYYPINSTDDRDTLASYRELATLETGVHFGGRLGTYQYLDMHMAIGSALVAVEGQLRPMLGIGESESLEL